MTPSSDRPEAAELSAMVSGLDELERRVSALAERLDGPDRDAALGHLHEAERALRSASKRLGQAEQALRGGRRR